MKQEGLMKRIAILVENLYEDLELHYPYLRLKEAGYQVDLIGTEKGVEYLSKHGYPSSSDFASSQVSAKDYDAVVVPGGYSPDMMRRCDATMEFVRQMDAQGKVIAAICHGPWIMASACNLTGKTLTSFISIRDDLGRNPDILLNLHIRNDKAVISLDTSGGALHRRGYREETVSAPMQETIAAAIIRFSEWDGSVPLYDPLCGSGTLLCEALMRYSNIPAGVFRNQFGCEFLPDFDGAAWKQVKKEADGNIRELPKGLIAGSDVSAEAVSAARTNLMGLHYGKNVSVERADFRNLPALEEHVIVTNPPYGIRIGRDENLEIFYKNIGDFLKQKCKGSAAFVYFGERKYIKNIGLKASWKKPIKFGRLDGRLVKYELY